MVAGTVVVIAGMLEIVVVFVLLLTAQKPLLHTLTGLLQPSFCSNCLSRSSNCLSRDANCLSNDANCLSNAANSSSKGSVDPGFPDGSGFPDDPRCPGFGNANC